MADEHDLIKIRDFIPLPSVTGNEEVPVTVKGGTYRANAGSLIVNIAIQKGFVTNNALYPIVKDVSELTISNSNKVDKSAIVDNLNSSNSEAPLSAKQGKMLNDTIASFSGQIGSGIIGEATPETEPITDGFGIYTVSTPGVYTNFKDANGDPVEVTQMDIDSGFVQFWGNDNVWNKKITPIEISTPVFSNTISDI